MVEVLFIVDDQGTCPVSYRILYAKNKLECFSATHKDTFFSGQLINNAWMLVGKDGKQIPLPKNILERFQSRGFLLTPNTNQTKEK
jgi:hypothetical protein